MTSSRLQRDIAELVDIIATAGGELTGRTRLQKTAYLLKATGHGAENFSFSYRQFGPFSENLASVATISTLFDEIEEEQKKSSWGGTLSVFRTEAKSKSVDNTGRQQLVAIAKKANSIELELAATAAFLSKEGYSDPWSETAHRKPEKAKKIDSAKVLYSKFLEISSPHELPQIV